MPGAAGLDLGVMVAPVLGATSVLLHAFKPAGQLFPMWELYLAALSLALLAAVLLLIRSNTALRFSLRSSGVRHGKTMEQLAPFMRNYPYDPRGFRFIGDPVDGVQFNEDGIVFVEFKTGSSSLSAGQNKIREEVKNKKVGFREVRL